jgi:hypothetical protein
MMPDKLDLEIAKATSNELLHQSIDRAVLAGKMRVEAAKDCLELFGNRCVVDEKTMTVTLNGLPLDAAVLALVEDRPLWQMTGPSPADEARKQLEADAKAGSVTAHGALHKSLGPTAYAAWCKANAAKPGKPAGDATDKTNTDNTDRKNPWLSGQWSLAEQGRIVKTLGLPVAQRMAAAAGVHVGAVRPVKAA